jgi:hypothetical protein
MGKKATKGKQNGSAKSQKRNEQPVLEKADLMRLEKFRENALLAQTALRQAREIVKKTQTIALRRRKPGEVRLD